MGLFFDSIIGFFIKLLLFLSFCIFFILLVGISISSGLTSALQDNKIKVVVVDKE